jgi:hypothetical protein
MLLVYNRLKEATEIHKLRAEADPRSPLAQSLYSYALLAQAAREGGKSDKLVVLATEVATTAVMLVKRSYGVPAQELAEAMCLSAYAAWYAKSKGVSTWSLGEPKQMMKEAKEHNREAKRSKQDGSECLQGTHYQQPHPDLAQQSPFRKAV